MSISEIPGVTSHSHDFSRPSTEWKKIVARVLKVKCVSDRYV